SLRSPSLARRGRSTASWGDRGPPLANIGRCIEPLAASTCSCLVTNREKGSPMPDDGRADAPNETGFGNLDEATLRALIEHVPVTVFIDRLDETGSELHHLPHRAT